MPQHVLRWIFAALVGALLAGCGMTAGDEPTASPGAAAMDQIPSRGPDVEGTVTQVTPSGDTFTMLVDFPSGGGTMTDSIRVVPGQTAIMRQAEAEAVAATADEITVGSTVKLWYTGPVMESYPRQATAAAVLLESTP